MTRTLNLRDPAEHDPMFEHNGERLVTVLLVILFIMLSVCMAYAVSQWLLYGAVSVDQVFGWHPSTPVVYNPAGSL